VCMVRTKSSICSRADAGGRTTTSTPSPRTFRSPSVTRTAISTRASASLSRPVISQSTQMILSAAVREEVVDTAPSVPSPPPGPGPMHAERTRPVAGRPRPPPRNGDPMTAITSTTFPAWVVRESGSGTSAALEQVEPGFLEDRGTLIRVLYSSINYKDALVLHGRPGVVRRTPLIAGIDLTGEVSASDGQALRPGTLVALHGAGLGEEHHGGLAALANVASEDLVVVPERFGAAQAAAIGTAGLTAALALDALEAHGLTPDMGPVLVTGPNGGSGGIAVALLAGAGYQVTAATGRADTAPRLHALGASAVIDRAELE